MLRFLAISLDLCFAFVITVEYCNVALFLPENYYFVS